MARLPHSDAAPFLYHPMARLPHSDAAPFLYHPMARLPHSDAAPFLPRIRSTGHQLGSLPSTACFFIQTRPSPSPLYPIGSDYFRAKPIPL